MARDTISGWLTILAVVAIAVSAGVPSASGDSTIELENVEVSAQSPVGLSDGALAFLRSESEEGLDLNGDSDTTDQVVHIRSVDGSIVNLGLAGLFEPVPLAGGGLVFLVSESSQGKTDLNGNGNTFDLIPHVWTPGGTPSSLGLAGEGIVPLNGGGFAFVVSESVSAEDLNGDGDMSDSVQHVWSPDGGTSNLSLATRFDHPAASLSGGGFAFSVPENEQGQDLNGDEDLLDLVVHVSQDNGVPINARLATTAVVPLTSLAGGGFAFVVHEDSQGDEDINENGTRTDFVVHLWLSDGTISFLEPPILPAGGLAALSDGGLAFSARELIDGIDFNGDGDTLDSVIHLWEPNGIITNLGLAGVPALSLVYGGLAFLVSEAQQNSNLNDDTDTSDVVLHVRRQDGSIANLRSAVSFPADLFALADGGVAYAVQENLDGRDLNGDTDELDRVLHVWRPGRMAMNTALAITSAASGATLSDGDYAFLAAEGSQSDDLNGDGDEGDDVLHISESDGTSQSLNLAVRSPLGGPVALIDDRIAFSVSEQGQRLDLNGDNDRLDFVLHVAFFRRNSPPVADVGAPYTGTEGSDISFDASTSSDPDGDLLTFSWDFGDGNTASDAGSNPSHTYADNGTYTVCVTVSDGTASDEDCTTADIANAPPAVGPIGASADLVQVGATVDATADFTDPGILDTHTATWDWGDGNTTAGLVTEADGDGSATGSHTYVDPGVYTVTLTVTDKDGGSDIEFYEFIVVYDPEGGFVTGGGSIESPEGAYAADPLLTAKATFGFVSKYKKGTTIPTGNTEFQFRAAEFNFHSSNYEWLVVTGSDFATFKGTGTINGEGEYLFRTWAGDGDPDTFRIKIWTEDDSGTEGVVYDNGFDQELAGGSIVIHAK